MHFKCVSKCSNFETKVAIAVFVILEKQQRLALLLPPHSARSCVPHSFY